MELVCVLTDYFSTTLKPCNYIPNDWDIIVGFYFPEKKNKFLSRT